tara:strand:+ start:968 stop:1747 length:780 start_codon:yes stop_codon:yes gene_type:complete
MFIYFTRFIVFIIIATPFLHAKNIRVMSYNIHHGRGTDGKVDLDRVAKLINDWSPDLVALQEVDNVTNRSNYMNETDTLSSKTKMFSVFGKNINVFGGEYGNAILSKYPIIHWENRKLPRVGNSEQRGALVAWLILKDKDKPTVFLSTHLDHRIKDAERLKSIEKIKFWLDRGDFGDDVIIAGDLNDTPSSNAILTMNTFCDGSNQSSKYKTFPSQNPQRQLDYIYTCKKGRYIIDSYHVIDVPVISDHLPIICDMIYR